MMILAHSSLPSHPLQGVSSGTHRVLLLVFNPTSHISIHILVNNSSFSADFWLLLILEADQEFLPPPTPQPIFLHFSNPAFPTDVSTRPPQMHSLGKSFPPSPFWSCLKKCCLVPPPCSDPHYTSPTVLHPNLCPLDPLLKMHFFTSLARNFHP